MNAPDNIDSFVTAIYRRFKDWNKRGFSADDVTWCEVKADIAAIIGINAAVEAERDELRRQIKIVQNAARSLEISGKEIAKHDRMRAEKLFAESKPEVIDSEREANAMLTEENLRLEQENNQLRARLDAACEWVPVAEAELKNSEPVIAWQNGGDWREAIHFHGIFCCPGRDEKICGVTNIMRIKPPASAENENV